MSINDMVSFSRSDVAEWADISPSQLEYLTKAGVIASDIGDQRKRFSLAEARLTVIAGCALSKGIKAQALLHPIRWLRENVSWPPIELPDNPADIAIELSAERYRSVPDFPIEKRTSKLAAKIFDSEATPELGRTNSTTPLEEALASDDRPTRERANAALKRARDMLAQPKKWSPDTLRAVERALDFEFACRGSADLYFHVSTGPDPDRWSTFLAPDVSRVNNETAWLVIDIHRLFSQRRPIF